VTTQDDWRQRGLVIEVQSERAARFHRKTVEALAEIIAAAGLRHPQELQPHYLTTRTSPMEARPMAELHTYLPENILLDSPEDTPYAAWWEAADAASFKPRVDLLEKVTELRAIQNVGVHL
jgi:hypothetical protein